MSLIAHWKLDGNLKDSSGNGHDLQTTSGAASYSTGIVTNKGWLGGSSTYLKTTDTISLGTYATISSWAKTTATGDMMWSINCSARSAGMNFLANGNSGYLLNVGDGSNNPYKDKDGNKVVSYSDGKWHHFVVTFNGSSKSKLYIDGSYKGEATTYRDNTMNNQRFYIGCWETDANYVWAGSINDVRVYDEVLSTKQIYELSRGLVCHYKFDEEILPYGYTRLEYLESTGSSQWINLGIKMNLNTYEFEIDHQATNKSQNGFIIGNFESGSNYWWYYHYNSGNSIRLYAINSAGSQVYFNTNLPQVGYRINAIYKNKTLFINGNEISNLKSTTFKEPTVNTLLFGGSNGSGTIDTTYPYLGRIFLCKIWNNSTLIRHLIPAKNSSGTLGMYDLVEGIFYTNAGSGTFTAGPEIKSNWKTCNGSVDGAGGWTNNGKATRNGNDTSISPPISGKVIYSQKQTEAGNSCITWSSLSTINGQSVAGKTMTASVYFYKNGTTSNSCPYVRSGPRDVAIAYYRYNGSGDMTTWPSNQWIRLSCTFTTDYRDTSIYSCSYINNLNEYEAFSCWQLEEGTELHPYVSIGTYEHIINDNCDNYDISCISSRIPKLKQSSRLGLSYAEFTDNQYVEKTGMSSYSDSFSISCWVNPLSNSSVGSQSLFSLGEQSFVFETGRYFIYNGNTPYVYYHALNLNTWYHVCITYNKNDGKLSFYRNGSLIQADIANTSYDSFTKISLAKRGNASPQSCKIADFKYYHTVLSSDDVKSLYQERLELTRQGDTYTEYLIENSSKAFDTRCESGQEYKRINASATTGDYYLNLPSNKYTKVYCDMSTKDFYNNTGWMCVASWNEASEWTKTSVSTSNYCGATPINAVSSNFGDCEIHAFRILVSDSITNVGTNATADFYYYWEEPLTWKEVWAAGPTAVWYYVQRLTLHPFDWSYNLKFNYRLTTHKYNRIGDAVSMNGLTNGESYTGPFKNTSSYNLWNALIKSGNNFSIYGMTVNDGSLAMLASNNTSNMSGHDTSSNNVKIGYDDAAVCKLAYDTNTSAGADNGNTNANGKKMWWFIL